MKTLTKEQMLNLLGILASALVTGVGFAIGGPIGSEFMASIGISLNSKIIQNGGAKLKERWLSSDDGILNRDIQRVLARAFINALNRLEKKYIILNEAGARPKEEKEAIKALFKQMSERAQEVFLSSFSAIKEEEIKSYLYSGAEEDTDKLLEHIKGLSLLETYGEHFRDFFCQHLLNEVQLCFAEELKKDNKECNRAWRAFQRLLLEGIEADVRAVRASQDQIHKDLQKLDELKHQLAKLRDVTDHRLPNEPFQTGLETAIDKMRMVLQDVAETTQRTEKKVDAIAIDIKTLLPEKAEVEIPKIPDDIQALFDEGWALRDLGKYEDARSVFQKSLELAINRKDNFAIAKTKGCLAAILIDWDQNPVDAKVLLQECLKEFKTANSEKDVAWAFFQLGLVEMSTGALDQAEAYFSQALELHRKNDIKLDIAWDLHQLGWIEDQRGHSKRAVELYDLALKDFLSVYQEHDIKAEKDAINGVAASHRNKGLVYKRQGKVEETESSFVQALDWYRKSGSRWELGKILYLLAEVKYAEAQYDSGNQFLVEAIQNFAEIKDYRNIARCLDLEGRVCFTLGQIDKASALFESALEAVEKSGDPKEKERYLNRLGHFYLEAQKIDKARAYFDQARDLSLQEELLDGYISAIEGLAQIANIERDNDKRMTLLSDAIQTLEKLLLSVQAEPRRAFMIGKIGSLYERMENYQQALVYYERAKKAFEDLSDIHGKANCLGSIAQIKGILGRKKGNLTMLKEEFETYRELKKLVDGSPFYELTAGTYINLGNIYLDLGNLAEARMLFQEAESLCQKYNLHYLSNVKKSIRYLEERINLRKPPELSFERLMEELFELVNWFPEAKDNILRLWMNGRKDALLSNYRNILGVKFMLCQDDVVTFLKISRILHPYSDLCLQVVGSEYPRSGIDMIPYPEDKEIFFDGYWLTNSTSRSEATGNEGVVIVGWSLGLPEQAHKLILSSSAAELIGQRIFFMPYERNLANDKLLSDLRLSKELHLIPVYFDSLSQSESVEVMTSVTLNLPVLLPEDAEHQRKELKKVRQSLSQLLSITKNSAQSLLDNFAFEINELSDAHARKESIKIQLYALDFPGALERESYTALLILDDQPNLRKT